MWHVVALGIADTFMINRFAEEVSLQTSSTLLDDLRESTWSDLPDSYEDILRRVHGVSLEALNPLFRFRDVAELCRLVEQPLFGFWGLDARRVHPVVVAFNASVFPAANKKRVSYNHHKKYEK